jgi:hypothetical protein
MIVAQCETDYRKPSIISFQSIAVSNIYDECIRIIFTWTHNPVYPLFINLPQNLIGMLIPLKLVFQNISLKALSAIYLLTKQACYIFIKTMK